MRIIVFSDTHGNINNCIEIIETIKYIDLIIHLGDYYKDTINISSIYPEILIEGVYGNCDPPSSEYEKLINVCNKNIFITHGHKYSVKTGIKKLEAHAKSLNSDIVLFGHTHRTFETFNENMYILNPGSIGQPRFEPASYGVIEIENNKIKTAIIRTGW